MAASVYDNWSKPIEFTDESCASRIIHDFSSDTVFLLIFESYAKHLSIFR